MDRAVVLLAKAAIPLVAVAGLIVGVLTLSGSFTSCAEKTLSDGQRLAVSELSDVVKWGLTVSVTFIGVFGSMILGLKEGVRFNAAGQALLISVLACFALSAYFAVAWRMGMVGALFNNCPQLIAGGSMSGLFYAHSSFFVDHDQQSWPQSWGLPVVAMTPIQGGLV